MFHNWINFCNKIQGDETQRNSGSSGGRELRGTHPLCELELRGVYPLSFCQYLESELFFLLLTADWGKVRKIWSVLKFVGYYPILLFVI